MIAKTFEIRDRSTFIPILAVKLIPSFEADRRLLARAGFGLTHEEQREYVLLSQINGGGGQAHSDPYEWDARTMTFAHEFIIQKFDALETGAVVDVEFILGEKDAPSESEAA